MNLTEQQFEALKAWVRAEASGYGTKLREQAARKALVEDGDARDS